MKLGFLTIRRAEHLQETDLLNGEKQEEEGEMQRREKDRISNLPDSIREHILKFLPLRDAGRASVLSTPWKNLWVNLPTLVFDAKFGSRDKKAVDKLMLDLCRVLMLHRGPLKEFSLSIWALKGFPEYLDQILLYLQDKHIESLAIEMEAPLSIALFERTQHYKLSKRLFSSSFSQLETLRLSACRLTSFPVSFEGFPQLTILELTNVIFGGSVSTWSYRCPLLSSLILDGCRYAASYPHIVIEAPNLCHFRFVGDIGYLHLKHTPLLKIATIDLLSFSVSNLEDESRLVKMWGGLAAVESLSVSKSIYKYMAIRDLQSQVLCPLERLRYLTLRDLCLSKGSHAEVALLLIKHSPNLQRLVITMKVVSGPRRFGAPSKFELSQLKRVEVKRLEDRKNGIAFIKWLLDSSPALGVMKIKLSTAVSDDQRISILTKLNGFQRASASARIIIN